MSALILIATAGGLYIPVEDPLDPRLPSLVYSAYDRAVTLGAVPYTGARPISQARLEKLLERGGAAWYHPDLQYLLNAAGAHGEGLFVPLKIGGFVSDPYALLVLPADAHARWGEHLFAGVSLSAYGGRRGSPYPAKDPRYLPDYNLYVWDAQPIIGSENLFELRQDAGWLALNFDGAEAAFGRMDARFGPMARYPLSLSGFGRPYDWLYNITLPFGSALFSAGLAVVPDSVDSRRLAYQRLELWLFDRLGLGLTEGVLYTRADPWKYANPLAFIYELQRHTSDNEDNLFLSLDGSLRIMRGLRVYGEFFADDPSFFYEGEEGSAGQAPLWAGAAGVQWIPPYPLENTFIRLEYAASAPWTYYHFSRNNSFTLFGAPLFLWTGSDMRALWLSWGFTAGPGAEFELYYERRVAGAVPVGQDWESSGREAHPDWPTGPTVVYTSAGALFRVETGIVDGSLRFGWLRRQGGPGSGDYGQLGANLTYSFTTLRFSP